MRILSHRVWTPLAKLSYLVYLVFPIVNAVLLSSMSSSLVLSYYTMFYLIAYSFISSLIVAFLAHEPPKLQPQPAFHFNLIIH